MPRTNQITDHMVAQIKAMKARGDNNQHIAAWFGINQGRISEICGINAKSQYRRIEAETKDVPPPGPYDVGGGGVAQLYRTIVEMRDLWNQGELVKARVRLDRLYHSLGRRSETDSMDEFAAEMFYDERGVPND